MAASVQKAPIDKSNEPVLGFGISEDAANESMAKSSTENSDRVIDNLARLQDRARRRRAEAAQDDLRQAESAAAALRRATAQDSNTAAPTLDSTAQTESDLSAIERLYGLSNLEYRQWLNNLQQLTDGLEQYGPLDPDAVVLKSATNVLAVSSTAVTYQKGTLTPQDALIGAILTYNNPASATGTVTIEGSLRARVLMTIASDMIGLTIKNPAIDMDAVRRNDPSVLENLPPELAQELGQILQQFNALKNLNPNRTVQPVAAKPLSNPANKPVTSNVTPLRALPTAASAVPATTIPEPAAAAADVPELSLVERVDAPAPAAAAEDVTPTPELNSNVSAADVKNAIQPSAAPSVAPELLPVLTDAVEPVEAAATTTPLQALLSKGDADAGIVAEEDIRAAFRIEAATPVAAKESTPASEDLTKDVVIYIDYPPDERAALANRPITKFPLLKYTPNGPKVLCP